MLEVKSCVLMEGYEKVTVWSPVLDKKWHFDREGYEKVTVWSPALVVESSVLIDRGMNKSWSGAP